MLVTPAPRAITKPEEKDEHEEEQEEDEEEEDPSPRGSGYRFAFSHNCSRPGGRLSPPRMPPMILARNGGPDGDALVVAAEPVHVDADAFPPHILAQGKGSRVHNNWYKRMWRAGRKQQVFAARGRSVG